MIELNEFLDRLVKINSQFHNSYVTKWIYSEYKNEFYKIKQDVCLKYGKMAGYTLFVSLIFPIIISEEISTGEYSFAGERFYNIKDAINYVKNYRFPKLGLVKICEYDYERCAVYDNFDTENIRIGTHKISLSFCFEYELPNGSYLHIPNFNYLINVYENKMTMFENETIPKTLKGHLEYLDKFGLKIIEGQKYYEKVSESVLDSIRKSITQLKIDYLTLIAGERK